MSITFLKKNVSACSCSLLISLPVLWRLMSCPHVEHVYTHYRTSLKVNSWIKGKGKKCELRIWGAGVGGLRTWLKRYLAVFSLRDMWFRKTMIPWNWCWRLETFPNTSITFFEMTDVSMCEGWTMLQELQGWIINCWKTVGPRPPGPSKDHFLLFGCTARLINQIRCRLGLPLTHVVILWCWRDLCQNFIQIHFV